jgi:hypothetical protein
MAPQIVPSPTPDTEDAGLCASISPLQAGDVPPVYGLVNATGIHDGDAVAELAALGVLDATNELDSAVLRLAQLRMFVPSQYESSIPQTQVRPLGRFSDMVAEQLGDLTERGRTGQLSAMQIYALVESEAVKIDDDDVTSLLNEPTSTAFHVARLDLAFAERAVAVAFTQGNPDGGLATWQAIRAESELFRLANEFATLEGSHPLLSWSDIASRHPILDVRSFLPFGQSRDQEVYMYRVQHAIDHGFRAVVLALLDQTTCTDLDVEKALVVTESIMRLMGHLSRVRDGGEFYKLDPYLGENNEVTGHGTGAFSVWVLLGSYLLRGTESMKVRLVEDANQTAFDSDAELLVRRVIDGDLVPFGESMAGDAANRIEHFVKGFHASHKAAVSKHAPTSVDVDAPATPGSTNKESMAAAIA